MNCGGKDQSGWSKILRQITELPPNPSSDEQREISLHVRVKAREPVIPIDCYSSFNTLVRVTSWVMRYVRNLKKSETPLKSAPTVQELVSAERYWISMSQSQCFESELRSLSTKGVLLSKSALLALHPFIDSQGVLRAGWREQKSKLAYSMMYPVILDGKHHLTKLIIRTEHLSLLHAGPALLTSSLNRRYHIIGGRRAIRSITRACIVCQRRSQKPQPQLMGQLPFERVTPDIVFENVGVDYAGPIYIKYGHVCKPTVVKSYICVFVSLSVKAVHLELVSDLTSEAFVSTFRRFIARRGKPSLMWSDHGSHFVGAQKDFKHIIDFLEDQKTQGAISQFCTTQRITRKFIQER